MPIYEYECQKCGQHFEVNQKISDPPLEKHEGDSNCGGKVAKLMSANTFHLKGSGWYKTDYAKPMTPANPGAKKEKKESPAGGESKAESKAEDKKETTAKKETAPAGGD